MRKVLGGLFAAAMLVAVPATAAAQSDVMIGIGGGVTLPMGDYGDLDKLGFHGGAGVSFGLGTAPIRLGVEGGFSTTSHKDVLGVSVDGSTTIMGGGANIIYPIPTAGSVKPYIMGHLGYYRVKVKATVSGITVEGSESKLGFGGGAGVMIGSGLFVQGRFMSISTSGSSTTFVLGTVGYRFALNK